MGDFIFEKEAFLPSGPINFLDCEVPKATDSKEQLKDIEVDRSKGAIKKVIVPKRTYENWVQGLTQPTIMKRKLTGSNEIKRNDTSKVFPGMTHGDLQFNCVDQNETPTTRVETEKKMNQALKPMAKNPQNHNILEALEYLENVCDELLGPSRILPSRRRRLGPIQSISSEDLRNMEIPEN